MPRSLGIINLAINEFFSNYITERRKKIDLGLFPQPHTSSAPMHIGTWATQCTQNSVNPLTQPRKEVEQEFPKSRHSTNAHKISLNFQKVIGKNLGFMYII